MPSFSYALNRAKLRRVRRREGCHFKLRSNLSDRQPADLWRFYIQLVDEAAFKTLKDDLQLRPIYHQRRAPSRPSSVAFMAYCLHVTLRARLIFAGGLTPRAVLDKFAAIQMLDVHFTTDGRTLILTATPSSTPTRGSSSDNSAFNCPHNHRPESPPPATSPDPNPPCSEDLLHARH